MEINEQFYSQLEQDIKKMIAKSGRKSQPFRDRYGHTLRVLTWALRIQEIEGGQLEIIRLSCLFHDCGWDNDIPHAEVSAQLAKDYLAALGYDKSKLELIVSVIRDHSKKAKPAKECLLEERILMDADLLDEVGAISVLWDAMACAFEPNPSYEKIYQRINCFLPELREKAFLLKTTTGRRLYEERVHFLEQFQENLYFELGLEAGSREQAAKL